MFFHFGQIFQIVEVMSKTINLPLLEIIAPVGLVRRRLFFRFQDEKDVFVVL